MYVTFPHHLSNDMTSSEISPPTTFPPSPPWSDMLPDLLGLVLTHLPLPSDRARFRAVCRAWRSAARDHVRQLPWIVFPDSSFCTVGCDGGVYFPTSTIPGLPDNVMCLGATAADGWLALDCTDDVFRWRMLYYWHNNGIFEPSCDVKHMHTYLLYNPFSGKTVLLPELDSIIGDVAQTFEIRKVLIHPSSKTSKTSPDHELIAVITNSYNYNIILCRPGKGICVLPDKNIVDIAFHGDRLYGITPEEELAALDFAEDDNGSPIVTRYRRVIKRPLADGEEDYESWMYDDSSSDGNNSDGGLQGEEEDDSGDSDDGELEEGEGEEDDDTSSQNQEEGSFNVDDLVPNNVILEDGDEPYNIIRTTQRLIQSREDNGDLLMVRHVVELSPIFGDYVISVDILKADMETGTWVPLRALTKGEALFLSRSLSTSTQTYGGIKEGSIYYTETADIFDTKSKCCNLLTLPRQWGQAHWELLSWVFPPELRL